MGTLGKHWKVKDTSSMTQEERVLVRLQQANGQWVNGNEVFLREMMLTQYHRAVWNLQKKRDRYDYSGFIEASDFTDQHGFKAYRLVPPAAFPPITLSPTFTPAHNKKLAEQNQKLI